MTHRHRTDRLRDKLPSKSPLVNAPTQPFVPATIADLGPRASKRFATFFTDNIRNPNTRRAYHRSAAQFFDWCASQGRFESVGHLVERRS
jgi:hypothetical protein